MFVPSTVTRSAVIALTSVWSAGHPPCTTHYTQPIVFVPDASLVHPLATCTIQKRQPISCCRSAPGHVLIRAHQDPVGAIELAKLAPVKVDQGERYCVGLGRPNPIQVIVPRGSEAEQGETGT